MIDTFNGFRKQIPIEELTRAKNILKRTILNNLSNQCDRLEETAKSVFKHIKIVCLFWENFKYWLY